MNKYIVYYTDNKNESHCVTVRAHDEDEAAHMVIYGNYSATEIDSVEREGF